MATWRAAGPIAGKRLFELADGSRLDRQEAGGRFLPLRFGLGDRPSVLVEDRKRDRQAEGELLVALIEEVTGAEVTSG
jgi:hypothetical protein